MIEQLDFGIDLMMQGQADLAPGQDSQIAAAPWPRL